MRFPKALATVIAIWGVVFLRAVDRPIDWLGSDMPTNLTSLNVVADTWHTSFFVTGDGLLQAAGNTNGIPLGLTGVRQLVGGKEEIFGFALLTNGTVVDLIVPYPVFKSSPKLTNVMELAAGGGFAMALHSNGVITAWGNAVLPGSKQNVPVGLSNVVRVEATELCGIALKNDGSAFGWGDNLYGEVSFPTNLHNVVDVAAGGWFSVLLLDDGTIRTFGDPAYKPPVGLKGVAAIAADFYRYYVLLTNGTVFSWPDQRDFHGIKGVSRIYAGINHFISWTHSPVIWNSPTNVVASPGDTVTFRVDADAGDGASYQWYFNDAAIAGATQGVYAFTADLGDAGKYWVRVSNADDYADSLPATAVVGRPTVRITSTNWIGAERGSIFLTTETASPTPLTFKWFFKGEEIAGRTDRSLTLTNLQLTDAGMYSVRVANAFGEADSDPAFLQVNPTPYLDQSQPTTGSRESLLNGFVSWTFAQTFVPSFDGRLDHVEFGCIADNIKVRILSTDASGAPGATQFGSVIVKHGETDSTIADFSNQRIYLLTGIRYAIEFSTDTPPNGISSFDEIFTAFPNPYSAGDFWKKKGAGQWAKASLFDDGVDFEDALFNTYLFHGVPDFALTTPAIGSVFRTSDIVSISPTFYHLDTNEISQVEFYAGGDLIGQSTTAPFAFNWTNPAPGNLQISAAAVLVSGTTNWTETVPIRVRTPGPANDDFTKALSLAGTYATGSVTNSNASTELGEPILDPSGVGKSVWWKWTAPANAPVFVTTTNSSQSELILAAFTGSELGTLVLQTNGVSAISFSAVKSTTYSFLVDSPVTNNAKVVLNLAVADVTITSPASNTVFTAPALVTITANSSTRPIKSVRFLANDEQIGSFSQGPYQLAQFFTNSGYYSLRVEAGDSNNVTTLSDPLFITVRPQNDNIANAVQIDGYFGNIHGSVRGASRQSIDPHFADNQGSRSIWYAWQAPADGLMTLQGYGPPSGLILVAGTLNNGQLLTVPSTSVPGFLSFFARKGVLYYFMVDTSFFEESEVDLSYSLTPLNDEFARSVLVVDEDFATIASLKNCGLEEDEPLALGQPGISLGSTWYRWSPPVTGEATIKVSSSSVAGVAVYSGNDLTLLSSIVEVPATSSQATISIRASKGSTYQVRVIGDSSVEDPVQISISMNTLRTTSPSPGSVHRDPARIFLSAAFSDNAPIHDLVFIANGFSLTNLTAEANGWVWNKPAPGAYQVVARGRNVNNVDFESAGLTLLVYDNDEVPKPRIFADISTPTSYVIDAVGAVYVFGNRPGIWASFGHSEPAFVALAGAPSGVTGWSFLRGVFAISEEGDLYVDSPIAVARPPSGGKWARAGAGRYGWYGLTDDGSVMLNGSSVAPATEGIIWKQFEESNYINYGLASDGTAWAIGVDYAAKPIRAPISFPAGVNAFTRIGATYGGAILLGDEGNLYGIDWESPILGPSDPPTRVALPEGVTAWKEFSTGGAHALAIGNDGNLYAWGRNNEGQLGFSGQGGFDQPVLVAFPPGVTAWLAIAAGGEHSLALGNDCSLYGFGANFNGQLGTGQLGVQDEPVRIPNLDHLCGSPIVFFDSVNARQPDGSFTVSFDTILNRSMIIQYSDDMRFWITVNPPVTGTGERITWIDDGPPKTQSHPRNVPIRFYQVILGP